MCPAPPYEAARFLLLQPQGLLHCSCEACPAIIAAASRRILPFPSVVLHCREAHHTAAITTNAANVRCVVPP